MAKTILNHAGKAALVAALLVTTACSSSGRSFSLGGGFGGVGGGGGPGGGNPGGGDPGGGDPGGGNPGGGNPGGGNGNPGGGNGGGGSGANPGGGSGGGSGGNSGGGNPGGGGADGDPGGTAPPPGAFSQASDNLGDLLGGGLGAVGDLLIGAGVQAGAPPLVELGGQVNETGEAFADQGLGGAPAGGAIDVLIDTADANLGQLGDVSIAGAQLLGNGEGGGALPVGVSALGVGDGEGTLAGVSLLNEGDSANQTLSLALGGEQILGEAGSAAIELSLLGDPQSGVESVLGAVESATGDLATLTVQDETLLGGGASLLAVSAESANPAEAGLLGVTLASDETANPLGVTIAGANLIGAGEPGAIGVDVLGAASGDPTLGPVLDQVETALVGVTDQVGDLLGATPGGDNVAPELANLLETLTGEADIVQETVENVADTVEDVADDVLGGLLDGVAPPANGGGPLGGLLGGLGGGS